MSLYKYQIEGNLYLPDLAGPCCAHGEARAGGAEQLLLTYPEALKIILSKRNSFWNSTKLYSLSIGLQ